MSTNVCRKYLYALILALLSVVDGSAQSSLLSKSAIFAQNEELQYSINFKWGIINGKLAEATITNRETRDGQYFSQLIMRTTNLADTFYPMRDTLETLYSSDKLPKRFEKRINENGYIASDVSTYTYSPTSISIRNSQVTNGSPTVDTTMLFQRSGVEVVDLLSTLALLRTYDFVNATKAPKIKAIVSLGRDKVNLEYSMVGVESITMPDGTRRQTMKVAIRVDNKTFKKGKNAVIVWLTQDKEQVPVKIRAELSIGATLVQLTSYNKR